jgi:hypothetical protein
MPLVAVQLRGSSSIGRGRFYNLYRPPTKCTNLLMFPRPFFEDVGRYLLPVLLLNVPQTILTSASSQDEPGSFLKITEQ